MIYTTQDRILSFINGLSISAKGMGISYLLYDQFTTDRAAGAVIGTAAELIGGTRNGLDTNSKISIISGELDFATGAAINDGVWYSSLARTLGRILIWKVKPSDANGIINLGWDTNSSGAINDRLVFAASGVLQIVSNGGTAYAVGTYTAGQTYNVLAQMRSTGLYWFVKGGTEYTYLNLVAITAAGTAAGIPAINCGSTTSIFKADDPRSELATIIGLLCYDTFTRGDGAIGNSETTGPDSQTTPALAWTGGAISTNKNVITPTGTELVTNGNMETGNPPSSWTEYAPATLSSVADERTGGSGAQSLNVLTNSPPLERGVYQILGFAAGTWLSLDGWTKKMVQDYYGGILLLRDGTYANIVYKITTSTSWTNLIGTGRALVGGGFIYVYKDGGTEDQRFDDVSVKALTLSSLFSSVSTSDADVIADANVTLTAGTQAGLVLNLDSTSSPANFIIAYHDGTNMHLDKCVEGVYTSLINTAAAYAGGNKVLRVITYHSDANTLKVRVYWNNAIVGAEITITNVGIISNTKHGLFSTFNSNSFDQFTLWARGSDNEYAALDAF